MRVDQPIPLSQIADRTDELDRSLLEISRQLSSIEESLSTDGRTLVQANEIRERLLFVESLVSGVPTATELRNENYYWAVLNRQYGTYRKSLTSRATYLQDQINFLDGQQMQWQATWDQVSKTRGKMEIVLERTGQELNKIRSTQQHVQDHLIL